MKNKLRVLALIDILKRLPEPKTRGQLCAMVLLEDSVSLTETPAPTTQRVREIIFEAVETADGLEWALHI